MALMLGHEWMIMYIHVCIGLTCDLCSASNSPFVCCHFPDKALDICWNDEIGSWWCSSRHGCLYILPWEPAASRTVVLCSWCSTEQARANDRLHLLQLTVECRLVIDCSNSSPLVIKSLIGAVTCDYSRMNDQSLQCVSVYSAAWGSKQAWTLIQASRIITVHP